MSRVMLILSIAHKCYRIVTKTQAIRFVFNECVRENDTSLFIIN